MVVGLVGAAPVAAADGDRSPGSQVSGTFSGSSTWAFGEGCGFARLSFAGRYEPDQHWVRSGGYTFDICAGDNLGDRWVLDGTFVVTTGRGATLSGTASGSLIITGTAVLGLDLTLAVTDSTGTRRPVTGTITVTGTTDESAGNQTAIEQGTFTADLHST
jgi:hypothetical protein